MASAEGQHSTVQLSSGQQETGATVTPGGQKGGTPMTAAYGSQSHSVNTDGHTDSGQQEEADKLLLHPGDSRHLPWAAGWCHRDSQESQEARALQ